MRFVKYKVLTDKNTYTSLFSPAFRSVCFRKKEVLALRDGLSGQLSQQLYLLYVTTFGISNTHYLSDLLGNQIPSVYFSESLILIFRESKTSFFSIMKFVFKRGFSFPTLSTRFHSANWLEREVFDMYGTVFFDHTNLRRILTDYGFKGFPLRKEFPVFGYKELRYDNELKQLIYTPVVLTQAWRNYLFLRQW